MSILQLLLNLLQFSSYFINNYDFYKNIILKIYEDTNSHNLLRLPMLEIISYNLDDNASLNSLQKVFSNKNDNSLILGKTAKNLAKKGVDISKEVEERYPSSDGIVKPYYAKILALAKPNSARVIIEKDMDREMEGNRKIKLISAFAKTGINDDYVINKLMDMIYNTIPNSQFHPFEKELFSSVIVYNISRSNKDDRFTKLIDIASTSTFREGTRTSALSELYFQLESNKTVDKSDIKIRLEQLIEDIQSSATLGKQEKKYLADETLQILNILKGF